MGTFNPPELEKAHKDEAPPYEIGEKGGYIGARPLTIASSSSAATVPPGPVPRRPIALPSGSFGSFSNLHLQTRFQDISGTYYIAAKNPASEIISRRKRRKHKIKHTPDAVFRTNRGNLSLDLATTGYANEAPRANVVVSTNSGRVSLNLISGAESKPRFDLEVKTRSGDIILFVSSGFSGAIQLHTKTGNLDFLPGIASRIKIMKCTDTEYLVLVGDHGPPLGSDHGPTDFCRLRSNKGSIIVGEREKDTYVKAPTVWQRLTGFLRH
ncbi:hypothetical protein B0H17DRAFT_1087679 [Mycena rosella]|uniref:DUF7330 domain-containing protein n=1 Tax=Mycena rosella TaxID=1033263 RepID=A0AAD7CXP4_MYCRO|nr:hypothetical protein B0H17DRAFT_1087679 [Mycena rosella]